MRSQDKLMQTQRVKAVDSNPAVKMKLLEMHNPDLSLWLADTGFIYLVLNMNNILMMNYI